MISVNKKIKTIQEYLKAKGWVDEYVIFNRITSEIEGTSQESDLISLATKPDSLKSKEFFYKFKHLAKDIKGNFNEHRLFEAWSAFDAATVSAEWFFKNIRTNN